MYIHVYRLWKYKINKFILRAKMAELYEITIKCCYFYWFVLILMLGH